MYERCLRRVRRRNAARRQALLDSIRSCLGDRVELTGAGAHVVLWPNHQVAEEAVIARAAARGVGVYGIAPYFLKEPLRTGILLGLFADEGNGDSGGIKRFSEVL